MFNVPYNTSIYGTSCFLEQIKIEVISEKLKSFLKIIFAF